MLIFSVKYVDWSSVFVDSSGLISLGFSGFTVSVLLAVSGVFNPTISRVLLASLSMMEQDFVTWGQESAQYSKLCYVSEMTQCRIM